MRSLIHLFLKNVVSAWFENLPTGFWYNYDLEKKESSPGMSRQCLKFRSTYFLYVMCSVI
jgi:hypothetical protein